MDTALETFQLRGYDPLDAVEQVVLSERFSYERTEDGEVRFVAPGDWRDHQVWFTWSLGAETLHLCLSLDAKAPVEHGVRLRELLTLLNERMWFGHFDLWSEDSAVVYRSALPLPGGAEPTQAQIATMIAAALEAGERFYPSFNLLMWGGKTPEEAVAAAMFETVGEA